MFVLFAILIQSYGSWRPGPNCSKTFIILLQHTVQYNALYLDFVTFTKCESPIWQREGTSNNFLFIRFQYVQREVKTYLKEVIFQTAIQTIISVFCVPTGLPSAMLR